MVVAIFAANVSRAFAAIAGFFYLEHELDVTAQDTAVHESARLGEGVMNGAFTGRIGIAAIDLCRPLPYIEAERPKLRDFLAALRAGRKPPAS